MGTQDLPEFTNYSGFHFHCFLTWLLSLFDLNVACIYGIVIVTMLQHMDLLLMIKSRQLAYPSPKYLSVLAVRMFESSFLAGLEIIIPSAMTLVHRSIYTRIYPLN